MIEVGRKRVGQSHMYVTQMDSVGVGALDDALRGSAALVPSSAVEPCHQTARACS